MSKNNFKLGERVFVNSKAINGLTGNDWGGSEGVVTHEKGWSGNVRVRLDNAPEKLKRVHDQQDGLWCYPDHMKRVYETFKLGERVFVDSVGITGYVGTWGGSEGVVTKETNKRGHVKVRLDTVPTILEHFHNDMDGLWCHKAHTFYVKRTFKVGDKVFVNNTGVVGCNGAIWNGSKGVVTAEVNPDKNVVRVKLDRVPYGFTELHDTINGLWCKTDNVYGLEREKPKNEIPSPCELRLSFVDNATTMSLVDTDGNVTCSATARCHPDDEFSVAEGMAIAFERLYQKYRKQNPEHSAIMIGDKVRLIKGATLPLITSYGNTETPSEIVLNEVGTVTSLSPNHVNAIVEWRENVVAAVATAGLEIVRETKDYYEWEEKVPFETPNKVCDELTQDSFIGKLDENERVDVGDMVESKGDGVHYRGMVVKTIQSKKCPWVRDVLVQGIARGNAPMKKLIREDFVKPVPEREPFVGEKVFALNAGVEGDYGRAWYSEEAIANEGRFCVVRGWHTNPRNRKRYAIVEHADGSASIDPDYIILLN